MTRYHKLKKLCNDLSKLHGWEGPGLIRLWIDGSCAQHIDMTYSLPGDTSDSLHTFHVVESVTVQYTMDEIIDRFIRECREGIEDD